MGAQITQVKDFHGSLNVPHGRSTGLSASD
jgi:hypothetical protein